MNIPENIEIFRAGDYGEKGQYSEEDINAIIKNTIEADHEPQIVVAPDHGKKPFNFYGRLGDLKAVGKKAVAKIKEMSEGFDEFLSGGNIRGCSVEIVKQAGKPIFDRLVFLTDVEPAVKGLGMVFSEDREVIGTFSVTPIKNTQEESVMTEELHKMIADISSRIDALNAEKDGDKIAGLKAELEDVKTRAVQFSEVGKELEAKEAEIAELKAKLQVQEEEKLAKEAEAFSEKAPPAIKDRVKSLYLHLKEGKVEFSEGDSAVSIVEELVKMAKATKPGDLPKAFSEQESEEDKYTQSARRIAKKMKEDK